MSTLTHEHLGEILRDYRGRFGIKPRVFIETGTALGKTTAIAAISGYFDAVHTIEKSQEMYYKALEKLGGKGDVNKNNLTGGMAQKLGVDVGIHYGDSTTTLPHVIAGLPNNQRQEPIVFYLDAHYCEDQENPRVNNDEIPLWKELAIIAGRKYADLIIIDDVHAFDRKFDNPKFEDWRGVTPEAMVAFLAEKSGRDSELSYISNDQFVIFQSKA